MILHDMLEIPTGPYFGRRNPPGLLTGFDAIDSGINGLRVGALHAFSSPPGIGATMLLVSICLEVSQHTGIAFVTVDGKEAARDNFVRMRNKLPFGSDLVLEFKMQERLRAWVRYPVAILGNTQTFEELQVNTSVAIFDVKRTSLPPKLLVVDCPSLFNTESSTLSFALDYLNDLARRQGIAIVVKIPYERHAEKYEALQIDNCYSQIDQALCFSNTSNSLDDFASEHNAMLDYQIILRQRLQGGIPMGGVAGNRVLRVVDRKYGHDSIQVLTIIPYAGICEETSLADDPDPDKVAFDP